MRRCIALAQRAGRGGDALVGSLLVGNGQVIAEGIESVHARQDVTAHAEIEAIRAACHGLGSRNLSGCVLYTTAEPCWMCSYAIRQTGIAEVIIGAPVAERGGVTSAHPMLLEPGSGRWQAPPVIRWSPLRAECEALRRRA